LRARRDAINALGGNTFRQPLIKREAIPLRSPFFNKYGIRLMRSLGGPEGGESAQSSAADMGQEIDQANSV
jgi:hypothetical protein